MIINGSREVMSKRTQLILLLAAVGALAFVLYQISQTGARTYAPNSVFTVRTQLAEFEANGVKTVAFLESDEHGELLLRATFAPIAYGFHLYSKDLDPNKTGGVGRATQFELLPNPSLRAVGQAFTDVAPQSHAIPELNVSIDIYPDGPVTMRLPIEIAEAATSIKAQVAISYMACKTDGVCLPPVDRQILDIEVRPIDLQPNNAAAKCRDGVGSFAIVVHRYWPGMSERFR